MFGLWGAGGQGAGLYAPRLAVFRISRQTVPVKFGGIGVLTVLLCGTSLAQAQDWQPIAGGVDFMEQTLPGPNHVTVLRVNLCSAGVRMRATAFDERGQKTSAWASKVGVVAAINGGFFVPGQPTNLDGGIAAGGGLIWPGVSDPKNRGFVAFGANRLQISGSGEELGAPEPWIEESVTGDATLVSDSHANYGFGSLCPDPYPITAVGVSADRSTLWMVTVDGKKPATSKGFTCAQMSDYLVGLGADLALKLDGGGSTTMWVKDRGVVNRPSDDGGERTVINHLGILVGDGGPPRNCMTRAIPTPTDGVKRKIANADSFVAWQFGLGDGIKVADDFLAMYPEGDPWPAGPAELVRDMAEGGKAYLLDTGRKRQIMDLYAIAAWKFQKLTFTPKTATELAAIPDGPAVTETPVWVAGSGPDLYVIDAKLSALPVAEDDGGTTPGKRPDAGGGCAVGGDGGVNGACALVMALMMLGVRKRRVR